MSHPGSHGILLTPYLDFRSSGRYNVQLVFQPYREDAHHELVQIGVREELLGVPCEDSAGSDAEGVDNGRSKHFDAHRSVGTAAVHVTSFQGGNNLVRQGLQLSIADGTETARTQLLGRCLFVLKEFDYGGMRGVNVTAMVDM